MKSTKKLYVAYGSNLHMEQMSYRCPDAHVASVGVLKNYSMQFWGNYGRNGVATVVPEEGSDVPVAVFSISESDEKNLDRYEGWPHLYRKENITVTTPSGEEITGMIYLMNERGMKITPPSSYYYNVIKDGYTFFNFDRKPLSKALRAATSKA